MNRIILILLTLLSAFSIYAQTNLENGDKFPTGYTKATNPYSFGSKDGVLYVFLSNNPYILVKYPSKDTRESFTIPNTVTRIARGAFKGCINLREIIIPSSVIYIGDNAFDDTELESLRVSGNDLGLNFPSTDKSEDNKYFSISGIPISNPSKGINIILNNGVSKKVLIE